MFFEGAEKKVEIIVNPSVGTLLDIPREYWVNLVESCQATILSEIRNDHLIAFLLSESSLFVWSDRILMLTCGQTVLINSVVSFVEKFGVDQIETLIYQRKNESFSQLQPTSFMDDVKTIKEMIPGKAYRYGRSHGHYNQVFHSETSYQASKEDQTAEVLMYDLGKTVVDELFNKKKNKEEVKGFLGLDKVLGDYQIDDYVFNPCGYSLNAIKGENYLTIHITPEPDHSYASLEFSETTKAQEFIDHFLKVFLPRSFDMMSFNIKFPNKLNEFTKIEHRKSTISSGYDVEFSSYFSYCDNPTEPEEIL